MVREEIRLTQPEENLPTPPEEDVEMGEDGGTPVTPPKKGEGEKEKKKKEKKVEEKRGREKIKLTPPRKDLPTPPEGKVLQGIEGGAPVTPPGKTLEQLEPHLKQDIEIEEPFKEKAEEPGRELREGKFKPDRLDLWGTGYSTARVWRGPRQDVWGASPEFGPKGGQDWRQTALQTGMGVDVGKPVKEQAVEVGQRYIGPTRERETRKITEKDVAEAEGLDKTMLEIKKWQQDIGVGPATTGKQQLKRWIPGTPEYFARIRGETAGTAVGAAGFGLGMARLGKKATVEGEPVEAGEELVKGTGEWFYQLPGRMALSATRPGLRGKIAGEIAGMAIAGKAVKTGYGKAPVKPAAGRISLGETRGITAGVKRTRGPVETFRPVVSVVKKPGERIPLPEFGRFGTEVKSKILPEEAGAAETMVLRESLPERGRGKIESFIETRARTRKAGLKPKELESTVSEVFKEKGFKESEAKAASEAVVEQVKKEEATVQGSIMQKAAGERVGEPGILRTPRDIDITGVKNVESFSKNIVERINTEVGRKVVEYNEGEIRVIEGESVGKVFDIHGVQELPGYGLGKRKGEAFGIRGEKPVKTKEGVLTTTMSEQATRKGQGAQAIYPERTSLTDLYGELGTETGQVLPKHRGRMKDIMDFYAAEKASIELLKQKGKTRAARKAETSLEKWLEKWGSAERIRKRYREGMFKEPKTELFKPSKEKAGKPSLTKKTGYGIKSGLVEPVSKPSIKPLMKPSTVKSFLGKRTLSITSKIKPSKFSRPSPKPSRISSIGKDTGLSVFEPFPSTLGISPPTSTATSPSKSFPLSIVSKPGAKPAVSSAAVPKGTVTPPVKPSKPLKGEKKKPRSWLGKESVEGELEDIIGSGWLSETVTAIAVKGKEAPKAAGEEKLMEIKEEGVLDLPTAQFFEPSRKKKIKGVQELLGL